jgi:hygromycin-B 7''-O-kinase
MTSPDSALTVEVLAALALRYGVPAEAIRSVPGGVANHAYALGDDLFLRIPRTPAFARDLRKEVAVIPIARAAGVRTPAIVDFDDTHTLLATPYLVSEQVRGTPLDAIPDPAAKALWLELARELAILHSIPATPIPGVEADDGGGDPRPEVDRLARDGYIDPGTARWLITWFDRLATRFDRDQPYVLLHGDIAAQNLLVDPRKSALAAVIDWGDAAWGLPGMEFAKLPLEQVAATLQGYGHHEYGVLEAAALWYHLSWGLSGLAKPPRAGERHWTAPPASRLLGVLRFFAASPAAPWSALT